MNTKIITKFIAILLLAMCSIPAFSQLRFGVRADVGLNNPSFLNLTETFKVENLTSFSVGGTLELMIPVVNFGIDASFLYNNHRMNISGRDVREDTKVRNHYLLLPVNAKKKFGLGILPAQFFVTAGPYVGLLLWGDDVSVVESIGRSPVLIHSDVQPRFFKTGIGFGFGVELLRRLQVGVQYRYQISDNYIDINNTPGIDNIISPLNERTSTWNLSATFFF